MSLGIWIVGFALLMVAVRGFQLYCERYHYNVAHRLEMERVEAMKARESKGNRPYIVVAEIIEFPGQIVGVPLGTELAQNRRIAFDRAARRWPLQTVRVAPWDQVDPNIRLAALEADRKIEDFN